MKIFIVIFVAVIFSEASADLKLHDRNFKDFLMKKLNDAVTKKLDERLVQQLEKIREILKNGNETLGIPVLDPFELDYKKTEFDLLEGNLKGFTSFDNESFTGLSEFLTEKAELFLFRRLIRLTLKWPILQLKTLYSIDAFFKNENITIYGTGELEQIVEDLRFETAAYFGYKSGYVYIKEMETKISIGNYKISITGLFNNENVSEFISIYITNLVPQVVEENQKELVAVVNSYIITYANEFLKDKPLEDLISF